MWSGAAGSISRGQWAVALFLLAAVLILGLGGLYAWWRRLGQRNLEEQARAEAEGDPTAPHRVCPTCARRYPAGARYCAVDASALSWVEGEIAAVNLSCPRCERSYEGARFCPFDAEELVRADAEGHEHHDAGDLAGSDKICPTCATRYEVEAAFCGRDGTRLCALH
jgi:hypothetical protein